MAKYEQFLTRCEDAPKAAALAKAWKSAAPATRKAACAKMGGDWEVQAKGSLATYTFHEDGTVTTVNRKREQNRWDEPRWAKSQKRHEVDASRAVIGFAMGRPIYV